MNEMAGAFYMNELDIGLPAYRIYFLFTSSVVGVGLQDKRWDSVFG
jgi:hypothetical protein